MEDRHAVAVSVDAVEHRAMQHLNRTDENVAARFIAP